MTSLEVMNFGPVGEARALWGGVGWSGGLVTRCRKEGVGFCFGCEGTVPEVCVGGKCTVGWDEVGRGLGGMEMGCQQYADVVVARCWRMRE